MMNPRGARSMIKNWVNETRPGVAWQPPLPLGLKLLNTRPMLLEAGVLPPREVGK